MFRAAVALLSALSFAPTASAQPGLPLSPGVHPGSSIGPGTQFIPQAAPRFVPPRAPAPVVPPFVPINPFPQFGFGGFVPFGGFGPYYNPYPAPLVVIVEPPPAVIARPSEPNVVLANEFPAALSVQFPFAARVWLNGKGVGDAAKEEWTFESAALPPGSSHTFELKARWERNGKTFEAARAVRVRAGDRSRLIVVSGTEVRE